jgi:hypothetical protein
MIRPVALQKTGFGKHVSDIVGYIGLVRVIVNSVHHQMRAECSAACLSPETSPLLFPPAYHLRPTTYQTLTPFVLNDIPGVCA